MRTLTYDAANNRTKMEDATGVTTHSYDAVDWVKAAFSSPPGFPLLNQA